jgi:hypothetical protein
MYRGTQHLRLMEGVNLLREKFGQEIIDVAIISAGYGLITETTKIVPYEVTFNNKSVAEINEISSFLNIHEGVEELIANYDVIFVLLSKNYLISLQLPIITKPEQMLFFFCSQETLTYLKGLKGKIFGFPLSNQSAKYYQYGLVGLKGFLFKKFAQAVSYNQDLLSIFLAHPEQFSEIISNNQTQIELNLSLKKTKESYTPKIIHYQEIPSLTIQSKRSEVDTIIPIPSNFEVAPNIQLGMQYFMPEWDDYVDPNYNFETDTLTPHRKPQFDDIYAHQMFDSYNYDGILVSRTVFDKSPVKRARILKDGIHQYIRFEGKILGDCGAFGYLTEDEPPYQTKDILDYYQQIGVNYGVSIDHLIFGIFAEEGIREKRYNLTIDNAQRFLDQYAKKTYDFEPIGAVQGWSPESYAKAVEKYIVMGYKYIAIGGLARAKNEKIIPVLKAIYPHLKEDVKVHLFGVGRLNANPIFRHLGVTSFDSASPLRKAWLDPDANYHCITGDIYAAVRIPNIDRSTARIKRIIESKIATEKTLKKLEQKSLDSLRKFAENKLDLSDTLDALLEYDKLLELPREGKVTKEKANARIAKHGKLYQKLLENRPWEKCDCPICQEIGVEVVMFRGNDRNRRRGFHNTYIFYKRFQEILNKG